MMFNKILTGLADLHQVFIQEIKNSLTDAGTVLIFVVAVIAYPVLYSFGYINETLKDVPVAVVDLDHSSLSRQYCRMIDATEQLSVSARTVSLKEAEQLFYAGKVNGVFLIPMNFEKDILGRKQSQVMVYCDASKFFVYKQVLTGGSFATGYFSSGIEYRNLLSSGRMPEQAFEQTNPLQIEVFNLYNPSAGYATFIVPGIMLIVIQQSLMIGIGLLAGRRYERRKKGHFFVNELRNMPVIPTVLGKAFAYGAIYFFTSLFLFGCLYKWLAFPARGSFLSLYFILVPYILTIAFAGLSLAFLFRKRVNSLMFIVFLSPAVFFLSGISWPAQSMPWLIRILAFIFPSTAAIPAFVKLRIIGGGLDSVGHEWSLLLLQMATYFLLACLAVWFDKKKRPVEQAIVE